SNQGNDLPVKIDLCEFINNKIDSDKDLLSNSQDNLVNQSKTVSYDWQLLTDIELPPEINAVEFPDFDRVSSAKDPLLNIDIDGRYKRTCGVRR
ncbi:MAG: hypothetical protein ACK45Z_10980, partial [Dolichospermum sp.]